MKLGKDNFVVEIELILIGLFGLDIVFGIGGLFKGWIIEIYGFESLGKMILMLYVVVEEQKKGGVCVFVDVEYVFDLVYVKKLGVDLDELLILQFDIGEQVLEIVDMFVWFGVVNFVVVDLVVVFMFKFELEGDMGDSSVGVYVCLMS